MFRPISAIIRFSSERALVFIRFMRLCNDGEISSSVVLIITTFMGRGWGGGVFCNVGIVLTWGAMPMPIPMHNTYIIEPHPATSLNTSNNQNPR